MKRLDQEANDDTRRKRPRRSDAESRHRADQSRCRSAHGHRRLLPRPHEGDRRTSLPASAYYRASRDGKTLLSEIVAREIACNLHTELAQNVKTPEHVHGALMMLEPGDILFFDEIHELPPAAQVTLYRALEERKLFLGKKHVVTLPPFCLDRGDDGRASSDPQYARTIPHPTAPDALLGRGDVPVDPAASESGSAGPLKTTPFANLPPRVVARPGSPSGSWNRRSARRQRKEPTSSRLAHVEQMCEIEQIDSLGLDADRAAIPPHSP